MGVGYSVAKRWGVRFIQHCGPMGTHHWRDRLQTSVVLSAWRSGNSAQQRRTDSRRYGHDVPCRRDLPRLAKRHHLDGVPEHARQHNLLRTGRGTGWRATDWRPRTAQRIRHNKLDTVGRGFVDARRHHPPRRRPPVAKGSRRYRRILSSRRSKCRTRRKT